MKPKIIASFDDGGIHDTRVAGLMADYEIETTFYIPVLWQQVNAVKGRRSASLDELKLIAKHHRIGAHTISHPLLPAISPDQAVSEICDCKAMLEELLETQVTSFCYPRGRYNEAIKDIVATTYTDARTTKIGCITEPDDPLETHPAVHVGYNRKEYEGLNWIDYGFELFDQAAKTEGAVFHLWGHSEEIDRLGQWDNLEFFLQGITK
jgi:peptidoglycan/xylan/chitin deacetylase (PgdA/CDA1 family)